MNKKIELIDFLRGFAIFTIALMHLTQGHLPGILNKAISFGGAGVHVFILVSGFGLYLSQIRKPLKYTEFLKKRFSKIYWPYSIAVLGYALMQMLNNGIFPTRETFAHLFLYKMFDHELDVSLCYPLWFISAIVQFYLLWPLIIKIIHLGKGEKCTTKGLTICLIISILWSTIVGLLGLENSRPWGSCCLQYLWEFALGMWLAEKFYFNDTNHNYYKLFNIENIKWIWLILSAVISMTITGYMGWIGGLLKLYNDIPSLTGYLSLLLIIYKLSYTSISFNYIKNFFTWSSSFGYELYLVHELTFMAIHFLLGNYISKPIELTISFIGAYIVAFGYNKVLKKTIYKK